MQTPEQHTGAWPGVQGLVLCRHCAVDASCEAEASGVAEASGLTDPSGDSQIPLEQSPLAQSEFCEQEVEAEGELPQWQLVTRPSVARRARSAKGLETDMSHLPSKALEFVGFRVVSPSGPSVSLRTTAAP